jgi:hypothetical protein
MPEDVMNKNYGVCTDALFARPSFLSGAARVLDMGGTFDEYNESATPGEADARALWGDWAVVGEDMRIAIEEVTASK